MKKLIFAALLLTSISSFAQVAPSNEKMRDRVELSPEQKSDSRIKEMTLELGLNEKQQNELKAVFLEQENKKAADRAARKASTVKQKLTAEEANAKKTQLAEERIAHKEKVKKVLTAEQFQKWESGRKGKMKDILGDKRQINKESEIKK